MNITLDVTIHQDGVHLIYPGFNGFYRIPEEIKSQITMTEKQYFCEHVRLLKIQGHIKAQLRRYIEQYVIYKESVKFDKDGNILEDQYEYIPGKIEPKEFKMVTLPWYTAKRIERED